MLALVIGAVLTRTALGGSDEDLSRKIVEEYLTAVAEGDAKKALDCLGGADDESLLTDEVLRVSNEFAPMTNITVGNVTKDNEHNGYYLVQASYDIGDESVSTTLRVGISSRRPLLRTEKSAHISSRSSLPLWLFEDIDYTVNGVVPDTDDPDVFPGTYELAASNEYLEITGDPIAATDPSEHSYSAAAAGNELAVSEAGVQMFRDKVIAEAAECLASASLDPGCGIKAIPQYPDSVPGCEEIGEDSVHRRQDAGQAARLETVTPEPDPWEPTRIWALGSELGRFTVTVSCRTGDTWGSREIADYSQIQGLFFGSPSIDLTDPDLTVVWNA